MGAFLFSQLSSYEREVDKWKNFLKYYSFKWHGMGRSIGYEKNFFIWNGLIVDILWIIVDLCEVPDVGASVKIFL